VGGIDARALFADRVAIDLDAPGCDQIFRVTARGHTSVGQKTREALAWGVDHSRSPPHKQSWQHFA
jgi:hypothetical protein